MNLHEAHLIARKRGDSHVLYSLLRLSLNVFLHVFYRVRVVGEENIPAEGAAIIVPNHKSALDPLFVVLATRRNIRFMGQSEHFLKRRARLFLRLGAFPVRKAHGEADADAIETARLILGRGQLLAIFPEGRSVHDVDELGTPRRGAARLAMESGAPLVPCAITGTGRLFLGPLPLPRRVQVSFAAPVHVERSEATPDTAAEITHAKVWPQVQHQFQALRAHPGLVAGALAVGLGAVAVVYRRQRR